MRIINGGYGQYGGAGVTNAGAGQSAQGSAEKVTLSARAQELAQQQSATADTAKVDRLREAVNNGSFKVDLQAVAKGIVDGDTHT
jgi:flagellar biosynthesis anti-sigma factor FlgM